MFVQEMSKKELILTGLEKVCNVMKEHSEDVDKEGRFPLEAISAMKDNKLMGAYIPKEYGGLGCSIKDLVEIGKTLGRHCASSAMVWAMHQIQLACLVHHGTNNEEIKTYLRRAAEKQYLIASITSEVGVGGDISRSIAGIEINGGYGLLSKKASVISYGAYADAYLATAKRTLEASETDQVLVLFENTEATVEQTSIWDTLGMRGTCSPGFNVTASFSKEYILDTPFKDIAVQSMVPVTHILWASVWYSISKDAVEKAQKITRQKMKQNLKSGIQDNVNYDLVEIHNKLNLMLNNIDICTNKYQAIVDNLSEDCKELYSLESSIQMNNLKMISSELAVEIVQKALYICGIVAFLNQTPYSLGRSLRDIMSSLVMIHNDRLYRTSSSLLMLQK